MLARSIDAYDSRLAQVWTIDTTHGEYILQHRTTFAGVPAKMVAYSHVRGETRKSNVSTTKCTKHVKGTLPWLVLWCRWIKQNTVGGKATMSYGTICDDTLWYDMT